MSEVKRWFFTDEEIAQVIHSALAEIQRVHNDPSPSPPWPYQSEEIRNACIADVRAVRTAKLNPKDLHEKWMRDRLLAGWKYGEEKDIEKKTHPCLIPFDYLPAYQQAKSQLFIGIVKALSEWGAYE